MTVVYLTRIDPAQNMARFYVLDVQPTLFGECTLVREWGRIGRGGQVRQIHCPCLVEADAMLKIQLKTKLRRGYVVADKRIAR